VDGEDGNLAGEQVDSLLDGDGVADLDGWKAQIGRRARQRGHIVEAMLRPHGGQGKCHDRSPASAWGGILCVK
jgi:hypothetical protein